MAAHTIANNQKVPMLTALVLVTDAERILIHLSLETNMGISTVMYLHTANTTSGMIYTPR
jgi:hypothetical protein